MNFLIRNTLTAEYATPVDIRLHNGVIRDIGPALSALEGEQNAEHIIDASGCVTYPGFINSHHHLAQSILKGVPEGLNDGLADWLGNVPYRFWPHFTPELMYSTALLGLAEQLRSGVTCCADHHYLYHAQTSPELEDALWQAAGDLGIRLVLCRGGANVKGSHKGMAKSGIEPESLEQTLARLDDSVSRYHQPQSDAMRRVVVAPTSLIHSSTPEGLKQLAAYARSQKLKLHSHLLEVAFDEQQAQSRYQMSAVDYAESCDWLGSDVWFAHLVQASERDIRTLAATQTGIAHCPTSNCRLGSGIAPVVAMQAAGMPVSIGVDGSASSESASMLQELNLTWLLHRATHGPKATSLTEVLRWGTRSAAQLLGLDALGELKVGAAADIAIYDLSHYRYVGHHSPQWAPLLAGEPSVLKASFVAGKQVVSDGEVLGLDTEAVVREVRVQLAALLAKSDS